MDDRFLFKKMFISPLEISSDGKSIKPIMEYPLRYCVIDTKEMIVIDIENELSYTYIETFSRLYVLAQAIKAIKNNHRVAITPVHIFTCDSNLIKKSKEIINRLENGEKFQNGNDVFNNEEYLENISHKQNKVMKKNK